MQTLPEGMRVALRVIYIFEKLGVEYHLGGSYASSIHGAPRQPRGVDLVAKIVSSQVEPLIAALGSDFYADAEAARRALAQKSSFNVVHLSSGVKVGVFVLGDGAFDRSEFDRAEQTRLRGEEGVLVRVKTAEDIILRKLQWCRLAGEVSDRQWGDVVGCLEAGRRDVGYLRHWARELEVSDLLELALSQASTV